MSQLIQKSAVFLLAHQDDETAVFQKILDELVQDINVICIFFTTGVLKNCDSSLRNNESISVLTKLGVKQENIYFAGDITAIPDGDLVNCIALAAKWLERFLIENHYVVRMFVPAWEGGHPDHDVLHAIGVVVGQRYKLLNDIRQYSLYNGYGCKGQLFRTFLPLKENGPVEKVKVSWRNRFRYLSYCLQYPTQFKTWIGLFPMMFLHYMLWGTQNLQPVSINRIVDRPHPGTLYYERRKFAQYDEVHRKVCAFLHLKNNK